MLEINLNLFKPRDYQIPVIRALENEGYRKLLVVLSRRAGKDLLAFNMTIRQAVQRVGTYFYVLPTFSSGRRIIWDNITNDGFRLLDYIPHQLIESKNEQQMRIRLLNGSVIQILGSDTYDNTLVGTNPIGIVFSEFALTDPNAYFLSRPILNANKGWVLLISTPRGKNSFYDLYRIAQDNPKEWFCYLKTVDDTQHISITDIQKEIDSGEMSYDLARQEYWVDFSCGQEGSYYSKYIDKLRLDSRITTVPYESKLPVNTSWDLGVHDATCIIFFQLGGSSLRIIDCYTNTDKGLDHYAKVLDKRDYKYNKHVAPHDIAVRELGSSGAMSRLQIAKDLGINFTIAPNLSIEDGIEACKTTFSHLWIDEVKCAPLIKALEAYRREYDIKKKVYKDHPLHDSNSNFADAFRMLCVSLPKTRDGLDSTPEELEKRYNESRYGKPSNLPRIFQDKDIY